MKRITKPEELEVGKWYLFWHESPHDPNELTPTPQQCEQGAGSRERKNVW